MSNVLRDYELIVIAVPQLEEAALATLTQRIAGWIAAANGTGTNTNVWGRRALAYAINKQTDGIYIQFNFQLASNETRDLERNLRLDEQVIRHLVIRLDEE